MKINSLKKQKHWYIIHTWSDKDFKGTFIDRASQSLHRGSPNIYSAVNFIVFFYQHQRQTLIIFFLYLRSCGRLLCSPCSSYTSPLQYLNWVIARVCLSCKENLDSPSRPQRRSRSLTGISTQGIHKYCAIFFIVNSFSWILPFSNLRIHTVIFDCLI